jgi:hypothetical protein
VPDYDINRAAVDRLIERASAALSEADVISAFSGTKGLAPTMVAVVAAVPATIVVMVSIAVGKPVLLVGAIVVMAATMALIMTRVNATRVVAEVPSGLVVLAARHGDLSVLARIAPPLTIEPGGGRAWLRVHVSDELLWVSRPAFGGIVAHLADPEPGVDPSSPNP